MSSRSKNRRALVPMHTGVPTYGPAVESAVLVDQATGTIGVDARRLPVPKDVYDADIAWPSYRDGVVSLWFGKFAQTTPPKLRTRVEMRYSFEAFFQNFWENSREFHAALKQRAQKRTALKLFAARDPAADKLDAEKDHSLWSTLEVISRTGNEACMDFYHCAPTSAAWYLKEKDVRRLHFDPVLRVLFTTDELFRLFEACEPIARHVEPMLADKEAL